MTRWFYVSIVFTIIALAGTLYVYVFQYDGLPALVPSHWNIHGEPDGWTPKEDVFFTFLLLPAVMCGVLLLTLVLPWLSPKQFQVDSFRTTYEYIMALVEALMGFLHLAILWGSLHEELPLNRLIFAGMFLFFALLGNVLGQVRRNFWMGVRTPWTLANDQVWIQTHRLAAWLFVAVGVLGFIASLLGVGMMWCFAGIMIAALVPVVYSLVLYKRLEKQGKI